MTWNGIVKALAVIGGTIASAFGGFDTPLVVLVIVMAVDYVSGFLVAIMGKSGKTEGGGLDSKVGWKGIGKKALMMLAVLVMALLDRALGTEAQVFRSAIIWFYLANEGLSILENMALAGVPFPETVKKALEQLRSKNNNTDGTFVG